jgi:hypothetical protein
MAPDGFHPDPAGHLAMAYGALKLLKAPETRRVQSVKARPAPWGYEAEFKLQFPPFFVEPGARKVLPFFDFQKRFNSSILRIPGLKAGKYRLFSGAWAGPEFTASELGRGIELASLWDSPFMARGWDMHTFVNGLRDVYARSWRALGMSGGYGAYRPGPHAVGIRTMPALEREKWKLQAAPLPEIKLRLVQGGERVDNGEFIGPWSFCLPPKKAWKNVRVDVNNPTHCFGVAFGRQSGVAALARTELVSPVPQGALLLLGSGSGIEARLNGRPLLSKLDLERDSAPDQERIPVFLDKGVNELWVKVTQKKVRWWGFHARFSGLREPLLARQPK